MEEDNVRVLSKSPRDAVGKFQKREPSRVYSWDQNDYAANTLELRDLKADI